VSFYIACDLGAGSGRVMLARVADGHVELEEIHRFVSEPVRVFGSLRWDVLGIFHQLKIGLKKIAERDIAIKSLSVDSWGVDYVLSRKSNPQLAPPFQYRDARTDSTYKAALEKVSNEIIYAETGIQFMSINTLYQLLSDVEVNPELLGLADNFLTIGDYFNYLFSGVPREEVSNASTTQLYNPRQRKWSEELIHAFGLPAKIFPELVDSGTVLGPVLAEVAAETGLSNEVQVVASCSHDTGAAVAAVPAEGNNWAFLSSGTWSLIGVELPEPLINEEVRVQNFTNEAGYGGTTRFLKNIIGMWIVQECRREWTAAGQEYSFDELNWMAEEAEPLRSLINPNAARFWKPDDMAAKVQAYCRETKQPVPESPGQLLRCISDSLALLYQETLAQIQEMTGREIRTLHIVGGGSKNRLLNQATANATGREIVAGPVEATAIGNVLIQAIALGDLDSLQALRRTVRASFPVETFHPVATGAWQEASTRFSNLNLMN
jgi:rhamnulokinase